MVAARKKPAVPRKAAQAPRVGAGAADQRVANPERGEHNVTLGGNRYLLRPTYQAQRAIEQQTGRSYAELAMAGQTGALRIEHAAVIVTELVNAGAKSPMDTISEERAGELIYEEGLPAVAAAITVAIIDALTGGRTASGEVKAAVA